MRTELCVCADIPKLQTTAHLVLIMHAAELKATTNTGRLAAQAFPYSEIRVRGRPGEPMSTQGIVAQGHQGLLLFPSDDAVELTADYVRSFNKPITLVVPDGTWGQAAKVVKREPDLAALPRVKLPPGPPSQYQLRIAPQIENLATIEAIARAMGVIDSREAQAALEKLLEIVVKRTLWSRGMLSLERCREFIPEAAIAAHKARSNKTE